MWWALMSLTGAVTSLLLAFAAGRSAVEARDQSERAYVLAQEASVAAQMAQERLQDAEDVYGR